MLQLARPSAPGSVPWGFAEEASIAVEADISSPDFPKSRAEYARRHAWPAAPNPENMSRNITGALDAQVAAPRTREAQP